MLKKITIPTIILFLFTFCSKIQNEKYGLLKFSTDTVFFDTIFTQIGSATEIFLVYNKNKFPIKIDKISLNGNTNSRFRLNINGIPQNEVTDVSIDPNDSIFIFVDVTINPGKDSIIVEDFITFVSGENIQRVVLTAFGRDVHLIKSKILTTQTWTSQKPYLIYKYAYVDSLQTLTIEPGTEIYFHYNSGLYCKGTIIANGTLEKPIKMQGDRIDKPLFYKDKPGQWYGIVLMTGSTNNYFNYVTIKESIFGIIVDSAINLNFPTLVLNNSKIYRCSHTGLYAVNSSVIALNSIITDCYVNNIALLMGGNYEFYHCTVQNDYPFGGRISSAVGIQNYKIINNRIIYGKDISSLFVNSIISGNKDNEFVANAYEGSNFAMLLKNCLMKVDLKHFDTTASFVQDCIFNKDATFNDRFKLDYRLKSNSPARNKAYFDIVNQNQTLLRYDIDGTDRLADGKPDIGALEFKEIQ